MTSSTPSASSSASSLGWPFLRLGFRPFYLGAAAFAAFSVPLWVAMFTGHLTLAWQVPALFWHAHEMLFGFAVAVIVGFLLTASKAWTGLPTPRGAALGALVFLWLAARLAAVVAAENFSWYGAFAVLDLLLLPIVALVLLRVLLRAGNRRNLPLVGLLFLLFLANLFFHAALLQWIDVTPVRALYGALALIVMIECVMAGRVVPAFTANATPGLRVNLNPRLERATLAVTALALGLWVLVPQWSIPGAVTLGLAAGLHLLRQWQWHPWVTLKRPILWILHAAYAWIALGLGLLALAQLGELMGLIHHSVGVSAAVHALAVGATGGLIIGMITRTARGHTGRPLQVSRAEVIAYSLVMVAALLRVLAPIAVPHIFMHALICAALAWSVGFAIYLWIYIPWLTQPRLDGKDG